MPTARRTLSVQKAHACMQKASSEKPKNVKNFTTAVLVLALIMIAGQAINFIITLLPSSEDAVVVLGDGTTADVSMLRNTYMTLLIIIGAIYGTAWYEVRESKNWARWVAVVLAVITAILGAQRLFNSMAAGMDMVGLGLALAQLIAAGWVLALAFRRDVHEWFKTSSARSSQS